jgi:hypothetical protein
MSFYWFRILKFRNISCFFVRLEEKILIRKDIDFNQNLFIYGMLLGYSNLNIIKDKYHNLEILSHARGKGLSPKYLIVCFLFLFHGWKTINVNI